MTFVTSALEKTICGQFPAFLHPFLKNVFGDKRYLTKKTGNLIINRLEKNLGRSYLFSYPYTLVIDPTNICNLKCPLCPTWQDIKARPKGKMNLATFSALLDEVGPYLFALTLCNWGEPLLNPELTAMIRYAKKFNIVTGLSTNLNYLPDETAQELAQSGIDIIVISIDGTSQENYAKYRVGGNPAVVSDNIKKLISYRQSTKNFPHLVWQFLVNKYNEAELDAAHATARTFGLQFLPSSMRTPMGKELLFPLHERVKEMKDWLPKNPAYNRYAYEITPSTRTKQTTCKWLWNTLVVNWDGSVSPCCGVFEKKWDFQIYRRDSGKKSALHRAWNSPRYRLARKLIAAHMGKSPDTDSLARLSEREGLICSRCVHYGFLED